LTKKVFEVLFGENENSDGNVTIL